MPHKEVARRKAILPGYQLDLKQQHGTARDAPCWRGERVLIRLCRGVSQFPSLSFP